MPVLRVVSSDLLTAERFVFVPRPTGLAVLAFLQCIPKRTIASV